MYTEIKKRTVSRTVVALPGDAKTAAFLQEASQRGNKRGIRVVLILLPIFAAPLFYVNAFLRPDRGTGVGPMIGAGFSALLLGGMTAMAIGFIVMLRVSRKAREQVDALIESDKAVEIHPLLRKLWLEELDRRGHALNREDLARSMSVRCVFFTDHRKEAARAGAPTTEPKEREQILVRLAKAMRTEAHRVSKPTA